MNKPPSPPKPIDARISLYRFLRLVILVGLFGILIRMFVLETRLVSTNQMSPALLPGDRLLVNKLGVLNPFSGKKSLREGNVVLFKLPQADEGSFASLRIAASPKDSFAIIDGKVMVNGTEKSPPSSAEKSVTPLPAEYSPRDAISLFVLPAAGDSVTFDTVSFRDMVFYASMIRRETQSDEYTLNTTLFIDSAESSDYIIKDFLLYTGSFSSIPDSLRYSWFFWDRLKEYFLTMDKDSTRYRIDFDISRAGERLAGYRFETDHFFLLADNWENGYDSRFFGPVGKSNIRGTATCILWSIPPSESIKEFRSERVCKIIR